MWFQLSHIGDVTCAGLTPAGPTPAAHVDSAHIPSPEFEVRPLGDATTETPMDTSNPSGFSAPRAIQRAFTVEAGEPPTLGRASGRRRAPERELLRLRGHPARAIVKWTDDESISDKALEQRVPLGVQQGGRLHE